MVVSAMKMLGNARGAMLAAVCAVGALVFPYSASAVTLNPGDQATVDFVIPTGTYQSLGLDIATLNGSLAVNFLNDLSGTSHVFSGPDTYVFNTNYGGGTVYATIAYTGSASFDTSSLGMFAYEGLGGSGAQTALIEDAVLTPIPASLPLFLTGAIILYALFRRRRFGHASVRLAA